MSATSGPVVDMHAHTFATLDDLIAEQAGAKADAIQNVAWFGESTAVNAELMASSWIRLLTDTSARLDVMARQGVDVQLVSITPTQYHYWADEELASRIVDAVNDTIGAQVAAAPDRLLGLGTVALQHPELAADQLARLMADPAFRGVEISTSAGGRDLGNPCFDPFWAAAERLGALVFIHPWGCSLGERLAPHYLGNVVGQPTETTVALSHLVFAGVLDRFPDLRICAAHGGGYLPHYLGRADRAWDVRPECRSCADRPSRYLRRLWFDSVVHDPRVLERLVSVVGADRVMLGTDHPFDMGDAAPLDLLAAADLSGVDRAAIAGGNVAALIGLGAAP